MSSGAGAIRASHAPSLSLLFLEPLLSPRQRLSSRRLKVGVESGGPFNLQDQGSRLVEVQDDAKCRADHEEHG